MKLMESFTTEVGIRIRYPTGWQIQEERDPDRYHLSVNADETTFWSLTLLFDRPGSQSVLEAALRAFQEEYSELDVYPVAGDIQGYETHAAGIDFVCLDWTNSAILRAFRTERFTVLLWQQVTDGEAEHYLPLLARITDSIELLPLE